MQRWVFVVAYILFSALPTHAAQPADVIVGVNVRGWRGVGEQQQDALVAQLQKDGVKTIRESLPNFVARVSPISLPARFSVA
jgi:hypothetical protein